jgi:hypothetical protein
VNGGKNGSEPSIRGGQVAEIQGTRELGGSRDGSPKVGCSKSRVAKSRKDPSRPSEEDRWQRSRDLVNSEVREGESPNIGYSKSDAVEDARSREEGGRRSRELIAGYPKIGSK